MPVVQIIAGHPVRYSLNNGFMLSEFDHGEFYEVPEHAARGMVERGWAKRVNPPPLAAQSPPRTPEPPPPPPPQPAPPPQPQKQPEPPQPNDDEPVEERSPRRKAR